MLCIWHELEQDNFPGFMPHYCDENFIRCTLEKEWKQKQGSLYLKEIFFSNQ